MPRRQPSSKHETADDEAAAQIEALGDTWHWTPVTDQQYQRYAIAGGLPEHVGKLQRHSTPCLAKTTQWPIW